jgi:hypothetical protein
MWGMGGQRLLKPALQLMNVHRLRIAEIKEDKVITSFTRWLEAAQVVRQGASDNEACLRRWG